MNAGIMRKMTSRLPNPENGFRLGLGWDIHSQGRASPGWARSYGIHSSLDSFVLCSSGSLLVLLVLHLWFLLRPTLKWVETLMVLLPIMHFYSSGCRHIMPPGEASHTDFGFGHVTLFGPWGLSLVANVWSPVHWDCPLRMLPWGQCREAQMKEHMEREAQVFQLNPAPCWPLASTWHVSELIWDLLAHGPEECSHTNESGETRRGTAPPVYRGLAKHSWPLNNTC